MRVRILTAAFEGNLRPAGLRFLGDLLVVYLWDQTRSLCYPMGWVYLLSMSLLYAITQKPSHVHIPPHLSYTRSTSDIKIPTTPLLSSHFRPGSVSNYNNRNPNFPNAQSTLRGEKIRYFFYNNTL